MNIAVFITEPYQFMFLAKLEKNYNKRRDDNFVEMKIDIALTLRAFY